MIDLNRVSCEKSPTFSQLKKKKREPKWLCNLLWVMTHQLRNTVMTAAQNLQRTKTFRHLLCANVWMYSHPHSIHMHLNDCGMMIKWFRCVTHAKLCADQHVFLSFFLSELHCSVSINGKGGDHGATLYRFYIQQVQQGGPKSVVKCAFVLAGGGVTRVSAFPKAAFSCYPSGGWCTTCWGCRPDGVCGVCVWGSRLATFASASEGVDGAGDE